MHLIVSLQACAYMAANKDNNSNGVCIDFLSLFDS